KAKPTWWLWGEACYTTRAGSGTPRTNSERKLSIHYNTSVAGLPNMTMSSANAMEYLRADPALYCRVR
ncbi:MAG: hypothetical protein QF358_08490, partial [Arenicellales bacterium]|nr:hypothetical protein [Arenicellales bacterium]